MYKLQATKASERSKKYAIIAVIVVAVITLGVLGYNKLNNNNPPENANQPKYPLAQQDDTPSVDPANPNDDQKANPPIPSEQVDQPVPVATTGSIAIAELEQANGYINTKATVDNFEATKCVYSFTNANARPVVRETANGCSGVSIPEVEFELIGTYTLTVTAYSTTDKLTATQEIAIQ